METHRRFIGDKRQVRYRGCSQKVLLGITASCCQHHRFLLPQLLGLKKKGLPLSQCDESLMSQTILCSHFLKTPCAFWMSPSTVQQQTQQMTSTGSSSLCPEASVGSKKPWTLEDCVIVESPTIHSKIGHACSSSLKRSNSKSEDEMLLHRASRVKMALVRWDPLKMHTAASV